MADESGGGMRLTGAGKGVLFLVGIAVLGYVGYTYRDRLPSFGGGSATTTTTTTTAKPADTPKKREAAPEPPKGVLAKIRQTGVVKVGMEPDAPPLHFINAR